MTKRDPIHSHPRDMSRLTEIMRRLRDRETGCPWDIEQDFTSIAPYTIEEAYEVADAIDRGDMSDLKAELGDLLFQAVYHAQMAAEAGHFTFDDVVNGIADKMIARHPHVFETESRDKSALQQTRDWEALKARERATRQETGVLDGVALGLPALMRAEKLQKRAARVGFDWPDTSFVLDKLIEEARELVTAPDAASKADEMGDLLFVMANLARHLDIDPETALRGTNAKFVRRFEFIESALREQGKTPAQSDLEEMDALWDAAKRHERQIPE